MWMRECRVMSGFWEECSILLAFWIYFATINLTLWVLCYHFLFVGLECLEGWEAAIRRVWCFLCNVIPAFFSIGWNLRPQIGHFTACHVQRCLSAQRYNFCHIWRGTKSPSKCAGVRSPSTAADMLLFLLMVSGWVSRAPSLGVVCKEMFRENKILENRLLDLTKACPKGTFDLEAQSTTLDDDGLWQIIFLGDQKNGFDDSWESRTIKLVVSCWNSKANHFIEWMLGDFQPFPIYTDLVHHPIETTIYKWLALGFHDVVCSLFKMCMPPQDPFSQLQVWKNITIPYFSCEETSHVHGKRW